MHGLRLFGRTFIAAAIFFRLLQISDQAMSVRPTVNVEWRNKYLGAAPLEDPDVTRGRDQSHKADEPTGKFATIVSTAVAILGALQDFSQGVPFVDPAVSTFIQPIKQFLERVAQVRVNKATARSMARRVDALMKFLACMPSSKEWESALTKNTKQLEVLQKQLEQLERAMNLASNLVEKWRNPMPLDVAKDFLRCNLDKDDIKDVESTINRAMKELTMVVSALNLVQTLEVRNQLQQMAADAKASEDRLAQQLEQAHQQDMQDLQGHLDELLGGQKELKQLLAAAKQEQQQEWAALALQLGEVAGHVGVIMDEVSYMHRAVRELTVVVRAVEELVKQQASNSNSDRRANSGGGSSGEPLVGSRFVLGRDRIQWDERSSSWLKGPRGFADVCCASYDGHDVAVKLLKLDECDGQRQKTFKEAAVVSRLNHPCIVRFWGMVPVKDSDNQVSLGLVMDRCDKSLQDELSAMLKRKSMLPLRDALHIAERIACGLKYLHTDAPIVVVHGDLKPANVLLKGDKGVMLTDFGFSSTIAVKTMSMAARHLVEDGAAGVSGGTLHWAAPELLETWARGFDAKHTFACDIYAFGLVLYQLLVGQPPSNGMPTNEVAYQAAVRNGKRPRWVNAEVPWKEQRVQHASADVVKELQALVTACWAAKPAERPTAQQVHTELVRLQGLLPAV